MKVGKHVWACCVDSCMNIKMKGVGSENPFICDIAWQSP